MFYTNTCSPVKPGSGHGQPDHAPAGRGEQLGDERDPGAVDIALGCAELRPRDEIRVNALRVVPLRPRLPALGETDTRPAFVLCFREALELLRPEPEWMALCTFDHAVAELEQLARHGVDGRQIELAGLEVQLLPRRRNGARSRARDKQPLVQEPGELHAIGAADERSPARARIAGRSRTSTRLIVFDSSGSMSPATSRGLCSRGKPLPCPACRRSFSSSPRSSRARSRWSRR